MRVGGCSGDLIAIPRLFTFLRAMFDQLRISNDASDVLITGQQLGREEFERRWDESPHIKYAELIDGVVRISGPVKLTHARAHSYVAMWIGRYEMETAGVFGCGPVSIRLDEANMPLPDSVLMIDPKCGGRCRISDDDLLEGAPELICEVTADATSFDLHDKLKLYERHGVQEYFVWRAVDRAIDWFELRAGRYEQLRLEDGLLKSQVFPGLWLRPNEMAAQQLKAVSHTLKQGAASLEHQEFVQRLHIEQLFT
jgi:Uma2 family endonuclease